MSKITNVKRFAVNYNLVRSISVKKYVVPSKRESEIP